MAALKYLHERGILVRNLSLKSLRFEALKPELLRLLDLTQAVAMGPDDMVKGIPNDSPFTPPEALRGKPIGFEADIFSLGVILLSLIAAKVPT